MAAIQSSIQISPATEADLPLVLQFIRELAVFEKLSDHVTATEAQLRQHLFGPRPYAEVLIARIDTQPAGFALFFHSYSTFLSKPGMYLEDLYVPEAWRGHGVGSALLEAVRQLAIVRGCGRCEWSVLNWNRRAIEFYEKMGARPLDEWMVYRLSGEQLTQTAPAI